MSPWSWYAGDPEDMTYSLAEEASRSAVIRSALKDLRPGDVFQIIEARSSDAARHEGSDHVPFLRSRNHEVLTVVSADDGGKEAVSEQSK